MSPSVHRTLLVVAVVLLALVPLAASAFAITLMNYIGIGAIIALGLVLLTGIGGLTSFGQAAFVGLGAYTTAVLSTGYGVSPWINLAIALAFTTNAHSQTTGEPGQSVSLQATDNGNDLLQELTLEYNKGRQQKITSEILDLVGGSMQ